MKFIVFLGVLPLLVCLIQAKPQPQETLGDSGEPWAVEPIPEPHTLNRRSPSDKQQDVCEFYCSSNSGGKGYLNYDRACICEK